MVRFRVCLLRLLRFYCCDQKSLSDMYAKLCTMAASNNIQ